MSVALTTDAPISFRVPATDMLLNPSKFEHMQRVATLFASSQLVPPHLRGKMADCFLAIHVADRMQEDPLTVLQNIYIVSGRAGWKTEYMVARVNKSGLLKGRIRWRTAGAGDTMAVTAVAILADEGEEITATADMKMARAEGWTKNAKYQSMPEHMLRWRSATMLIRLYLPEVMLGIPTVDEIETMVDVTPAPRARKVAAAELVEQAKTEALPPAEEPAEEQHQDAYDAETGEILEQAPQASQADPEPDWAAMAAKAEAHIDLATDKRTLDVRAQSLLVMQTLAKLDANAPALAAAVRAKIEGHRALIVAGAL